MVTNIDRAQLLELIDQGAQIVDVLPDAEYDAHYIPGAISIPLRRLDAETSLVLRRENAKIVLHCLFTRHHGGEQRQRSVRSEPAWFRGGSPVAGRRPDASSDDERCRRHRAERL